MSYSQVAQDLWVLEKLRYKTNGYFLDWGAWDGVHINNTYLLEKDYDWVGIYVEPNTEVFNQLIINRLMCYCENVVVYNKNGLVDFIEQGGQIGGVLEECADFHKEWIKKRNIMGRNNTKNKKMFNSIKNPRSF